MAQQDQLTVCVVGPGAIGCALAAALIEAGHLVKLAGRTPFDALQVTIPNGSAITSPVVVATRPVDVQPAALTILATKAYQSEDAAPVLRAATGAGGTLLVAQNGISHRERIEPLVGDDVAVVPCVVFLPATRHAPGTVQVTGPPHLEVPDDAAGRTAAAAFAGSFLDVRVRADFGASAWTKLMLNAGLGAVGALTRQPNDVFLNDPEGRRLTRDLFAEILPVARAEGAALDDGLPDRLIARVVGHAAGHLSSITVDRMAGQPTEWRERNAVIGEIARRHGIPTPLNDVATTLLRLGEPGTPDQAAPAPLV